MCWWKVVTTKWKCEQQNSWDSTLLSSPKHDGECFQNLKCNSINSLFWLDRAVWRELTRQLPWTATSGSPFTAANKEQTFFPYLSVCTLLKRLHYKKYVNIFKKQGKYFKEGLRNIRELSEMLRLEFSNSYSVGHEYFVLLGSSENLLASRFLLIFN